MVGSCEKRVSFKVKVRRWRSGFGRPCERGEERRENDDVCLCYAENGTV